MSTMVLRHKQIGRGAFLGGLLATALVHGGIVGAVWWSHVREAERPQEEVRDLIVTKLVKLGKPREKFWLPRKVTPPAPTRPQLALSDNAAAAPAPKEAPKPEDAQVSKDLKRALERARLLQQAANEPEEGDLAGSIHGTANEAQAGDLYATQIFEAIRRNWNVPKGVGDEATLRGLTVEVRVRVAADGTLLEPKIAKPSRNDLFDDSCLQAVIATAKVPPPPAQVAGRFARGLVLEFEGKDLAR